MSDKEKKEKVVTKYDLKMQRRQAEKEKELKQKKISMVAAVVVAIALVAFIASFPIRTYLASHETVVTVNGENITRAEFDYYYNVAANSFINQNGAYLSYFGFDANGDYAEQMYSENLTWKDFFEESAVDNLKTTKALKADAKNADFQYDSAKEVKAFKKNVKDAAKAADMSAGKYLQQVYGKYASMGSVSKYVAESAKLSAYLQSLSDGLKASDEEILNYYSENSDTYDCVDYYIQEFSTDIAEDATEDQIAAAMEVVEEEAYEALERLAVDGEFLAGVHKSDASYLYSDWLFDDSRKQGDTVTIPDENNHAYYAIRFDARYMDDAATVNAHIIVTEESKVQSIMDAWNNGDLTRESFINLWEKYSTDTSVRNGLYENIAEGSMDSEIGAFLFADARKEGDVTSIVTEDSAYVVYYVSAGAPVWQANIASTLLTQAQNEYVDALVENVVVDDANGNLNYLKVQNAEDVSGGDVVDEDVSEGDVSVGDAE